VAHCHNILHALIIVSLLFPISSQITDYWTCWGHCRQ